MEIETDVKKYTINIYRTKMCNYGLDCRYINSSKPTTGFNCDYAHSPEELNTFVRTFEKLIPNSIYKTIPCFRGLKCDVKDCTYAHSPEELNLTPCNWGKYCGKRKCTTTHPFLEKQVIFDSLVVKFSKNFKIENDLETKTVQVNIEKKEENKKEKYVNVNVNVNINVNKQGNKMIWADEDVEDVENEE